MPKMRSKCLKDVRELKTLHSQVQWASKKPWDASKTQRLGRLRRSMGALDNQRLHHWACAQLMCVAINHTLVDECL
eukprot:2745149-Amphidinium_carterae.1